MGPRAHNDSPTDSAAPHVPPQTRQPPRQPHSLPPPHSHSPSTRSHTRLPSRSGLMRYPPCSENGNPVLSAPISAPFGSSSHMHPPTAPSQTPYPFGSYTWQRPAGHHPQQKILVSAIIMCQRLSLIPEVLTESHRLTLSAIVKYTSHRTIPKPWATIQHVQSIGRLRMYWGWARLYFLIMASTIYLWRVQDAAGIQWRWLQIPGWITFYDHKINRELVSYPLSDYMDAWRAYIVACKRSDVPWDAAVIPGGARELQRAMANLLRYEELAQVRWHGWKKLGAALFILLGGALSSLQRWGRWHSPHQPRRYSHAPPAWRLPDRVQLPYPVATTNSPVRDMEWRLVRLSELWPRDTFAKPCTAPVRAPQQLELAYAATYQPSSTGRESDETPSIGESTDTDRSDVQSQCSESTSMAQSESMEAPPTTNHAIHHGVTTPPPAGEPLATCPATAPGGCPSMGAVASAVAATPLPSSQVPDGVHHGSTGGLEGRMGTVRPAGPISEPPAKRPMCGHQPTSDPTPHHGYELTAPMQDRAVTNE